MASVDTLKRDLVKTIDAMKKNLEKYKNAKDENTRKRHAKLAYKLQDKKKKLEKDLDAKIGGLYADAELELKEFRKVIRKSIIKNLIEADVFSDPNVDMDKVSTKGGAKKGTTDPGQTLDALEKDVFKDIEKDIKRTDLEPTETEAVGTILTLAGVALSLPEIIKLIGKFANLVQKVLKMSPSPAKVRPEPKPGLAYAATGPGGRHWGESLIELGNKWHGKITKAFVWIMKRAGVKDAAKAKKFANIIHHVIVAMLLIAGGLGTGKLIAKGNISGATLKAALNAIKTKELRAFLITSAEAIT